MLPTQVKDFQAAAYWDKFTKARGGAAFEWYLEPGALWDACLGALCSRAKNPLVLHVGEHGPSCRHWH